MISLLISLAALIIGYVFYGKMVERAFGIDPKRKTPVTINADGIDYVPMPSWKIFMIQFLNIAGLGPIFGAIMGAKFGISAYLWIVFGCIIAGATHDYVSGMISLREDGASLPEIIGKYLGKPVWVIMRIGTLILMILIGAVFVSGPAGLLAKMTPNYFDVTFWTCIVFGYYTLATMLPIDKLIGKVYPLFAIALLFMAVGILGALLWNHVQLPEFTDGFRNTHPSSDTLPIFPVMFVSIACGAVSGFHATQSPMMARCMKNEKQGRPIFYGAMIAEGVVALIWAAAANWYYSENGMGESNAAIIVDGVTREWLGSVGCVLAMLGVIAAPITSGDTALRSARMMAAEILKIKQNGFMNRLTISIPIFLCAMSVLVYSQKDSAGFDMIWRYFSWTNQLLSCLTLWTCTVYFVKRNTVGSDIFVAHSEKNDSPRLKRYAYLLTLFPAIFMTMVCVSYICIAPEGFRLPIDISYIIGGIVTLVSVIWFIVWIRRIESLNRCIK